MCLIFLSLFDECVWYSYHYLIFLLLVDLNVWYYYHCLIWMCFIFLSLFDMNVFDIPIIVWRMCLIFLSLFDMNVFDIPIIFLCEFVWYSNYCLLWMCLIFLSLFDINVFDILIIGWYEYVSTRIQCKKPFRQNTIWTAINVTVLLKTIQTEYNINSNQCYCPVKNHSDRIQYQQQSMLLSC
jgi:hypothetical protein